MNINDVPFHVQVSEFDLNEIYKMLDGIKDGVPRALVRALNSTATKARNQAVTEARKDVRLTSAFLKARIKGPADEKANKANFSNLRSKVTASTRGLRLAHFLSGKIPSEGRPSKPPKVKVKPAGAAKPITGGFLLKLKNTASEGNNPKLGIFIKENGKNVHLYGPSPSQIYQRELPGLSVAMSRHLRDRVGKETQAILKKYGGA